MTVSSSRHSSPVHSHTRTLTSTYQAGACTIHLHDSLGRDLTPIGISTKIIVLVLLQIKVNICHCKLGIPLWCEPERWKNLELVGTDTPTMREAL